MKYQSIYFSPTGTTKAVLEAVTAELFETGSDYDLTLPEAREEIPVIEAESVLVVGAPVYSGRIPEIFEKMLRGLMLNGQRIILLVVYGNRAYEDALVEMKDYFEKQGCTIVGAAAFVGEHSCNSKVATARPDLKDIEKAKQFAREIVWDDQERGPIEVSGNRPYRERKPGGMIGPSTTEFCTQCKQCAENCPVGAIDWNDCTNVDESKCITCYKCVRVCPVGAKYFDERMDRIVKWLEDNCLENRLEPEWFV